MAAGTYGPWNQDVAPELREPYSYLRTAGGALGARPTDPRVHLTLNVVLLVLDLGCLTLVLPKVAAQPGLLIALAIVLVGLAGIVFSFRMALSRLAWVSRVKAVTGKSPFEMDRQGIAPPRA